MKTKRLLNLVRFLRKLKNEYFEFSTFINEYENECGTVCCAIGWLPKVDPKNWEWRTSRYDDMMPCLVKEPSGSTENTFDKAAEYFGIAPEESRGLFHCYNEEQLPNHAWNDRIPQHLRALVLPSNSTPSLVAEQIERFVKFKQLQMRRNKRITSIKTKSVNYSKAKIKKKK